MTKYIKVIVKINDFSVFIIFLQSAVRRELSITSIIHMSVAVITCKSKIPF